ncbi:MAG: hypothetical protein LBH66_03435 [Oscillospiraceae bacterium]|jgi:hypothetical protein|nr:hypothetical protein [Oscillospiraceae bacterium]
MRGRITWKNAGALLLAVAMMWALAGCSGKAPEPAPTSTPETAQDAPPTEADAEQPAAWPDDEAIQYCPEFEGGQISRVTKQAGNQTKSYIIAYDKVDQDAYDAYALRLEEDEGITVVTNFNTRGTSYQLHAYKTGDEAMAIRITYTKPTQKLQINVAYAP